VLELSEEELEALVDKATVDAYDDDEQRMGFAVLIEENLAVPFETTVLGVRVTVMDVTQMESGIVADLDQIAAAGEAPWERVGEMIATKKTSEYDRAVALLHDLRSLAGRHGEEVAFEARIRELRAQYPGRPGLRDRLDKAGLPGL
jgi:hypothetical protein